MIAGNNSAPEVLLSMQQIEKKYKILKTNLDKLKIIIGCRVVAEEKTALEAVTLEISRGECVGLIGDNGAGKSTFLKLVAGVIQPSGGRMDKKGRITAILELGAGFHPEFTGRENILFSGELTGLSRRELETLAPDIIEFSGIRDAIDRPVKTYSSGMVVRLAFALVTAVQPDILIIDEALAVGDQNFQRKCIERIEEFKKNGCTILFCSHSAYHIRTICTKVIWLERGKVKKIGRTDEVMAAYEAVAEISRLKRHEKGELLSVIQATNSISAGQAAFTNVDVLSLEVEKLEESFYFRRPDLEIKMMARCQDAAAPIFGIMLEKSNGGEGITSVTTADDGFAPRYMGAGQWEACIVFPDYPLHTGEYTISAYLFDSTGLIIYDEWKHFKSFRWITPYKLPGLVRLPHRWS